MGRGFRIVPWIISLAVSSLTGCRKPEPKLAPPKPPVVLVSRPELGDVVDYEEFTGRTQAFRMTEVRARVDGYLDRILFRDGTEVNEGELLFVIDQRPYIAERDRAKAALAQAQARLAVLDANFARATKNYSARTISREEFDKASGDRMEAEASVGVAQANLDLAKLNLSYTEVKALIGGRISRRMVDIGNLVKTDQTMLTTIVALDPIYVYFDIDERTLLRLRRLIEEGKMRSREQGELPVLLALSDETDFPHKGVIDFSENALDAGTGTLRVRATVANPKPKPPRTTRFLSPGMFVRVRLPVGEPHRAILVDEAAIGTDQGRKYVYVVNSNDEVVSRSIKVGSLHHGKRLISEGLSVKDRVIVNGLQRVRPGAKVDPKPAEKSEETAADTSPVADQRKSEPHRKNSKSG